MRGSTDDGWGDGRTAQLWPLDTERLSQTGCLLGPGLSPQPLKIGRLLGSV